MARFLVAIHHPNDYNPAITEDTAMSLAIDRLNEEMLAAGVRVFVGGLHPARNAKSLCVDSGGEVIITDGPYLNTSEQVGGVWVLDVADLTIALNWGRKATNACRAPVEVRPFY